MGRRPDQLQSKKATSYLHTSITVLQLQYVNMHSKFPRVKDCVAFPHLFQHRALFLQE